LNAATVAPEEGWHVSRPHSDVQGTPNINFTLGVCGILGKPAYKGGDPMMILWVNSLHSGRLCFDISHDIS